MKFAKYHFIQKQTRRNLAQKEYIMIVQVKYNKIQFPFLVKEKYIR